MKKSVWICAFFTAIVFAPAFQLSRKNSNKKIAYIVAIGNYQPGSGWGKLASMVDDTLVTEALKKQGFGTFIKRRNAEATLKGIRTGFEELIKNVNSGDVVVIHFASHGQQIFDDGIDEIDKLDEAIVPYDAKPFYKSGNNGYKGENHLRDDEIGMWVSKIRQAAGAKGDVLLTMDACHSGTMLRGPVVRGGMSPLVPSNWKEMTANLKAQNIDAGSADNLDLDDESIAPVLMISAAKASEPNKQAKTAGSLSLALSNALNVMQGSISYRQLFSQIVSEMSVTVPNQTPVAEGKLDRVLFGGDVVAKFPYYSVNQVYTNSLTVQGGTLVGLHLNTKVKIIAAGSENAQNATTIAEGYVSSSDQRTALIKAPIDPSKYTAKQLWVVVTEKSFGSEKIKIAIQKDIDAKTKSEIKRRLEMLRFVEIGDKNPDLTVYYKNKNFELHSSQGYVLANPFADINQLNAIISLHMQSRMLMVQNFHDSNISIEFELLVAKVQDKKLVDTVSAKKYFVNGVYEFPRGTALMFKIINKGKKPAYANILNISTQAEIKQLLPEKDEDPAKYYLIPGSSYWVADKVSLLSGPAGKETFKLFATEVPINFYQIGLSRGNEKQVYQHPMEKMLQHSFLLGSRGDTPVSAGTSNGGTTFSVTFLVK